MEGHKYFIEGIPKPLWKDFKLACIYFDTTAKDYFIYRMNQLVKLHHRTAQNAKAGPVYQFRKEKKQ